MSAALMLEPVACLRRGWILKQVKILSIKSKHLFVYVTRVIFRIMLIVAPQGVIMLVRRTDHTVHPFDISHNDFLSTHKIHNNVQIQVTDKVALWPQVDNIINHRFAQAVSTKRRKVSFTSLEVLGVDFSISGIATAPSREIEVGRDQSRIGVPNKRKFKVLFEFFGVSSSDFLRSSVFRQRHFAFDSLIFKYGSGFDARSTGLRDVDEYASISVTNMSYHPTSWDSQDPFALYPKQKKHPKDGCLKSGRCIDPFGKSHST
jgi:hypothetical protein